jgi:hypothetical protein
MPTGSASEADRELIDRLRTRGVEVSAAQLERWRAAGALPRNERRGLGRGAGSVSVAPPESAAIAEGLARVARPGRSLHETVLRIFAADPRFDLKIFLVTPALPVPERAVRAALTWFVRNRVDSVHRRIERAVAAASSDDEAEDVASELAERHYRRAFRSDRRDFKREALTEGLRLTAPEAGAFAVFTLARLLGQELVGSDRFAEAFRDSIGRGGQYQDEADALVRFVARENAKRELSGQPTIGSVQGGTIEADVEAIGKVSLAAICQVRDTLSLLAEAAMIYRATRDSIPEDQMVRRLIDFFTSSYETHLWVCAATPLSYTPLADSWKWMTSMIVMICSDPGDLESFQEMARRIDFTVGDLRGLVSRSTAERRARRAR